VDVVGGTPMGEFVESSKFGIVVQSPSGAAAASSQNQTTNTTSESA
jgi:hypothetical protein